MKRSRVLVSKRWATFLRIPNPNTSDRTPALDPAWCAARGINSGAEIVLRLLQNQILPLVRVLEYNYLRSYHFLIHDRLSGVPAPEGDNDHFIHLNLVFKKPYKFIERGAFEFTHPIHNEQKGVGGIDLKLMPGGIERLEEVLCTQSMWVLRLIESHVWKDDADMVRQVQQFGHYFSNMLQMQFR